MYLELVGSILRAPSARSEPRKRWRSAAVLSVLAVGLVAGTVYAGAPLEAAGVAGRDMGRTATDLEAVAGGTELAALEARVESVNGAWAEISDYYMNQVAPIRRVLLRYRNDPELAERVAVALVREANQVELEPRLLLAVLLVENPWLDPEIRSSVGAVGLMQVMPFHRGAWSACKPDLEDIDANICHGARIFADYFRASAGDVDRALLRYNGCVRGTNTPNCHQYPYHVFARAGRASVLAWLETGSGPVAASR